MSASFTDIFTDILRPKRPEFAFFYRETESVEGDVSVAVT
jgi:hypothetical protein